MITATDLATRVGGGTTAEHESALAVGKAAVDTFVSGAWRPVPEAILDECYLRAATAVFKGAKSQESGSMLGADGTISGGFIANDPLRKCYDMLKRYVKRV